MKKYITIIFFLITTSLFSQNIFPSFFYNKKKRKSLVIQYQQPEQPGDQTTYYVSSSEGNDSNSGKATGQAWKTLDKVNSFKPSPGDQVLFKRGNEWVGTLTVTASGTSGSPITYGAYGTGEKPKFYGSEEITGWSLHSGNIYKATFNIDINQLFINNVRAKLARYPNSGYTLIDAVGSTTNFTDNDLPNFSHVGATFIGRTEAWSMSAIQVSGGSSNTNLSLASPPLYALNVNDGFFLCNKLEYLDQAGEWYYDSSTNTVYLWTLNGDSPSNYEVRGSTTQNGLTMTSVSYVNVENIEFSQHSDIAVNNDFTTYTNLSNIDIYYPDDDGMRLNHDNNSTYDNIKIIGANGVGIDGNMTNCSITNCQISNIGLFNQLNKSGMSGVMDGKGINIWAGNNILIQFNTIKNVAYNGIHWRAANTTIDKNLIDGACLVIDDGGGIYTWDSSVSNGVSSGSVVSNNIILNVHGTMEGGALNANYGYGIYMDDYTRDVTIENNTVAFTGNGGIFLHLSNNVNVTNNTVIDSRNGLYHLGESGDNYVTNNIFYSLLRDNENITDQRLIYQRQNASAIYSSNSYFNHYKNSTGIFKDDDGDYTFATWQTQTSQDANSTFDGTSLGAGEIEVLFYNAEKTAQVQDLSGYTWRDLDGNAVTSLTLQPFTSKILIRE